MDRNRKHEQTIERGPGDAAARARKNIGRAHAMPRRIEDHGDMNQDQRRHDGGGGALPEIEPHVHTLISPLRYAAAVRRLSAAIAAVGLSACGHSSWQD